jgi:hypothetical protein
VFIIVSLKFYANIFTFTKPLLGPRQIEEKNTSDMRVEKDRMGEERMIVCGADFRIPSIH